MGEKLSRRARISSAGLRAKVRGLITASMNAESSGVQTRREESLGRLARILFLPVGIEPSAGASTSRATHGDL